MALYFQVGPHILFKLIWLLKQGDGSRAKAVRCARHERVEAHGKGARRVGVAAHEHLASACAWPTSGSSRVVLLGQSCLYYNFDVILAGYGNLCLVLGTIQPELVLDALL